MNIKNKIINYLNKHPDTNNFELSIKLNLSIQDIDNILENLEDEGLIILN